MLDLTSRPQTSTLAMAAAGTKPTVTGQPGPTLTDLHAHVTTRTNISEKTRARYLGAIEKAGERLNMPLAASPAELALVEERFALDGFDPAHWSTDAAYQLFRRRLRTAVEKSATGAAG